MSTLSEKAISNTIRSGASELGFDGCGIARAGYLSEDAERLKTWLAGNRHGEMNYMQNHFEKRTDPTRLLPGARTVIVLLQNYYPQKVLDNQGSYKISRYAYGEDYHFVLRKKMAGMVNFISSLKEDAVSRAFVDSAPVLERAWARDAGLGWIGKNTCLITKERGSYFFIGVILTSLKMEPDDKTVPNHCGGCTRCLEACPTGALGKDGLDARKCISYLTIEYRGEEMPAGFSGKMEDWIFGCDICQEVCPWNRLSDPHSQSEFNPPDELAKMTRSDWEELTEDRFRKLFRNSPLKRTKFTGIKRNVKFAGGNRDGISGNTDAG